MAKVLISKRFSRKKKTDKKMLPAISQWTEEDIKAIEDAGNEINKWQLETLIPTDQGV